MRRLLFCAALLLLLFPAVAHASTYTDIQSLKARATALEKRATALEIKDKAQDAATASMTAQIAARDATITALSARVSVLEAVPPTDLSAIEATVAGILARVVTLEALAAATPTPSPTPTVTPTPTVAPTPTPTPTVPAAAVFNVLSYGAKADGVTDDHEAFHRAVNAAVAAGGGTVYAPAGVYRLVGWTAPPAPLNGSMALNVYLPAGVSLKGDGIGQTILHDGGANYVSAIGSVENNVTVSDLSVTIDPAGVLDGTTRKDGFKFIFSNNLVVKRVSVEYAYIGINLSATDNVLVQDSEFTHSLIGVDVDDNQMGPYIGTSNVTIQGVEVSYCRTFGFAAYYMGDGNNLGVNAADVRMRNVTWDGCYAHDNESSGFFAQWTTGLTLTNSRSENNYQGVVIRQSRDYWLDGNSVLGNTEATQIQVSTSNARTAL